MKLFSSVVLLSSEVARGRLLPQVLFLGTRVFGGPPRLPPLHLSHLSSVRVAGRRQLLHIQPRKAGSLPINQTPNTARTFVGLDLCWMH